MDPGTGDLRCLGLQAGRDKCPQDIRGSLSAGYSIMRAKAETTRGRGKRKVEPNVFERIILELLNLVF